MSKKIYKYIVDSLKDCYAQREACAIAREVLEVRFGVTRLDLCMGKDKHFSLEERADLENIVNRLAQSEPVQYVLGQASFCGLTLEVAPGVLIPRPETEELVEWICWDLKDAGPGCRILDVGTGSGCIAIALAKAFPDAQVMAWDISPVALDIAQRNARQSEVGVRFEEQDMLCPQTDSLMTWDLIVSNPPYICMSEKRDMMPNVLDYEPHSALFVPDDDPLRFYKSLAALAERHLSSDGALYLEINRAYFEEIRTMCHHYGFSDVTLKKDIYGNDRMVRCRK